MPNFSEQRRKAWGLDKAKSKPAETETVEVAEKKTTKSKAKKKAT